MDLASPQCEPVTLVERGAGAWLGPRPPSRGAALSLILRLWACIGLVLVLLAPHVGVASVGQGRALVASSSADALVVDELGDARGSSSESCVHPRDDRSHRAKHALCIVTPELNDEDSESDAVTIPTAILPTFELARVSSIFEYARVDTGRPSVAAALARGPPAAR